MADTGRSAAEQGREAHHVIGESVEDRLAVVRGGRRRQDRVDVVGTMDAVYPESPRSA
jgi:hypothetical protein